MAVRERCCTNAPTMCIKKSSNNLTYGEMPTTSLAEMQTKKSFRRLNKMGFQREKPEIQMSYISIFFLSETAWCVHYLATPILLEFQAKCKMIHRIGF